MDYSFQSSELITVDFVPFDAISVGLGFGLTSGVITTLGLMIGLNSGTQSRVAVIGGIVSIAIADAFSDALGIHVSEEATGHCSAHIWLAMATTFLAKLLTALSFLVPVLTMKLNRAIKANITWGIIILVFLSLFLSWRSGESFFPLCGRHVFMACAVLFLSHFAGVWIGKHFNDGDEEKEQINVQNDSQPTNVV